VSALSSLRLTSRAACASFVACLSCGCAASDDGDPTGAHPAAQRASILDGTLAPEATSVVAVMNFAGGQCSGSLIAPNLVLTARHCIASSEDDTTAVVCDETMLENTDSAGAVFIVPLPQITDDPKDFHAVRAIRVPEGATTLCGNDVALLELSVPLALPTLTPRVDSPLLGGEPYSALGYGIDGSQAHGRSGVRRQLDGLQVTCVGEECTERAVFANEWVGPGGACSGDSGGPALDAEGRVIGVLSRGKDGCLSPVYANVFDYGDWLRSAALSAAQTGHYHPMQWSCPDCPPEQKPLDSSCAFRSSPAPSSGIWLGASAALLALCALRRWRRR
jgi:hypothetical protein